MWGRLWCSARLGQDELGDWVEWSLRLTTRLYSWQPRDQGRQTDRKGEQTTSIPGQHGQLSATLCVDACCAEMDVVCIRYVKLQQDSNGLLRTL